MQFFREIDLRTNNPKAAAEQIKNDLQEYKVIVLRAGWHISNLREFYDQLSQELGNPVNIDESIHEEGKHTGEKWLEVRYDSSIPDDKAYRYSKYAQPLHTDESYIT